MSPCQQDDSFTIQFTVNPYLILLGVAALIAILATLSSTPSHSADTASEFAPQEVRTQPLRRPDPNISDGGSPSRL